MLLAKLKCGPAIVRLNGGDPIYEYDGRRLEIKFVRNANHSGVEIAIDPYLFLLSGLVAIAEQVAVHQTGPDYG